MRTPEEAAAQAHAFLVAALETWGDAAGAPIHAALMVAAEAPDIARAALQLIEVYVADERGVPAELVERESRGDVRALLDNLDAL